MSPELAALTQRLAALLDGARPVLLPAPYASGHYRVHTNQELPANGDFTAVRRGETLLVTLTDNALARALSAPTTVPAVEPSLSPLHTLVYQILAHGFIPDEMDCPALARLALELDDDPARCRRALERMEPLLRRAYAQALRTGRTHSMLPRVAGRVALCLHNTTYKNGGTEP